MKPIKEIEIAVALCERDETLLLLQRKDINPIWDTRWEFPGGKIEQDETPQDAVKREVFEETGLTIKQATFFLLHHHDWDLEDKILRVHLHCFHCEVDDADVHIETDKAYTYAWPTITKALDYESLSANRDILKKFIACKDIELG